MKTVTFFSIICVRGKYMETLEMIGKIFGYILPVVGVIAVIALIVVLIKVIKILSGLGPTVKKVDITVEGVNEAIGTTNGYLKDLNTTVKAVNNMSMSVEAVRATTERVVKKTAKEWNKQYDQVKGWVTDVLERHDAKKKELAAAKAPQNKDERKEVVE